MISFRQADYQDYRHDEDWIDQKILFEFNRTPGDTYIKLVNVNAPKAFKYLSVRGISLDMNVSYSKNGYIDEPEEGDIMKLTNSGEDTYEAMMRRIVKGLSWDSAFDDVEMHYEPSNKNKGEITLKSQREGRPI